MTISKGGFKNRPLHGAEVVKPQNPKKVLIRLWDYLKPHKAALFLVLCTSLISTLISLAGPYLIGVAIDGAIQQSDPKQLARITGLMLVLYLCNTLATWLQNHFMVGLSNRAVQALRNDLYGKVLRLPIPKFDKTPTGELMSRMINDVQNISSILSQGALQLISGTLSISAVITVMFLLNWRLALVTTFTVPVVFFIIRKVASGTRANFKRQQENMGQLNSLIEENITGLKVIQAYGQESRVFQSFTAANEALQISATRAQIFSGIISPLMSAVNNISYAVVVGFGGLLAVQGLATVGTLASFVNYSRQFSRPVNQIAALYNATQSALAGAERVFELMDEPGESDSLSVEIPPDAVQSLQGSVSFNSITFSYIPGHPVLQDISFQAASGDTVAIVGPTGSGKTTLINLLARFYDPDSGTIEVDKVSIMNRTRRSLRSRIGVVLQDTWLFSGSVLENIRYGRLSATDEEVMAAARMANAEAFIHRMPQGYGTLLSEEGANLSQGQRQMIAIARAILANPDILILDEATSNVDTRTEVAIQSAMRVLMKGRTSFVIAHRLRTIIHADRILVIQDGRIIEAGTHEDLLRQKGPYHALYIRQFEGE